MIRPTPQLLAQQPSFEGVDGAPCPCAGPRNRTALAGRHRFERRRATGASAGERRRATNETGKEIRSCCSRTWSRDQRPRRLIDRGSHAGDEARVTSPASLRVSKRRPKGRTPRDDTTTAARNAARARRSDGRHVVQRPSRKCSSRPSTSRTIAAASAAPRDRRRWGAAAVVASPGAGVAIRSHRALLLMDYSSVRPSELACPTLVERAPRHSPSF